MNIDWSSVGKSVAKFAPALGTVIGGPAGAAVGSIVASALGTDDTPQAVYEAIKADPSIAIKLKQIESDNEQSIRDHIFKMESVHIDNMKNARDSHKHNPMPAIICIALTLLVGAGAYMLFTINIPDSNNEIAYLLFGTLLAKWGDSIAYWVGTTRSSAEKNRWAA